jgi:hypothetical protein
MIGLGMFLLIVIALIASLWWAVRDEGGSAQ